MTRRARPMLPPLFAALLLALASCSVFQRDKGNEPPTLALSSVDTLRVGHGGQVSLEVRAADEDDDELFYAWDAFGAGTFSAPDEPATTWIAPDSISGTSETFLLTVVVRDRDCEQVPDPDNRQRCEEAAQASQLLESFLVEVLRTPPAVSIDEFTAAGFDVPVLRLEAAVSDEDGDPLEAFWSQVEGEELFIRPLDIEEGTAAAEIIPFFSGEYILALRVTDGSDTLEAQTRLQVSPPRLPTGGMQTLQLRQTDASLVDFEMDRYEYPNERAAAPRLADSFFEAARLCAAQGKRLCSADEWRTACQGEALGRFSSTDDPGAWGSSPFGLRFCNTPGSELAASGVAPSGSFANCSAGNGVYDLTGNAAEWVTDTDGEGSPLGRLQSSSSRVNGFCDEFGPPLAPFPPSTDLGTLSETAFSDAAYDDYRAAGNSFRCCR